MGVVAVETRTVETSTPADPANLDSELKVKSIIEFKICKMFIYDRCSVNDGQVI